MYRQQIQLSSRLYGPLYDKENLTDKIFERGRVIGLYRKGNISYKKMSRDMVSRITSRAIQDNTKFPENIIHSSIKGKAYSLKLGLKDALPEVERNENFLCHIYGRKKMPFEKGTKGTGRHLRKQSEAISYISHSRSSRIESSSVVGKEQNIRVRFRRGVSQLINDCNQILGQIKN